MRALIRFLSRSHTGAVEQRDKVFEGDSLTLGRATDRTLHLKDHRVALKHARILRSADRILIASSAVSGVIVNGAVSRDAQLKPGDVVGIGSNVLKLFTPPAGFDLAFTFELDSTAQAAELAQEAPRLSLSELGLGKRGISWTLFLGVLALCLIIPVLGVENTHLQQTLRTTPLPDDLRWSPGALHLVHRTLSGRCEACHEQPFVQVRDSACLSCHGGGLHSHVKDPVLFVGARCTDCHAEHQPAQLVRRDEGLCIHCHGGGKEGAGGRLAQLTATDFAHDHPPFPTVIPAADGRERSGLKFPHALHLAAKGLKAPQGTVVLQCADCHRPEPGGARMQPIKMEVQCQGCHRLDFDPADPQRQVPHGDAAKVLQSLVEYYSARYLESYPDPLAVAHPERAARRPGVELTAAQRERALEHARTKAQSTARDLFERRICNSCHEVRADGAAWKVEPAHLIQRWMPAARFNHARHTTAATPCESCHAAKTSKTSSDVLMPKIGVCRQCHGGSRHAEATNNLVPSTCTMCHDFHLAVHPLWHPRKTN